MNEGVTLSSAFLVQSAIVWYFSKTWSPLASLLSIQLRLVAYSFLRWIPGRHGPTCVPIIFALWLLSWRMVNRNIRKHQLTSLNKPIDTSKPAIKPPSSSSTKAALTSNQKQIDDPQETAASDPDTPLSTQTPISTDQSSLCSKLPLPTESHDLPASSSSAQSSTQEKRLTELSVTSSEYDRSDETKEEADGEAEEPSESTPLLSKAQFSPPTTTKPIPKSSKPVRLFKSILGITTDSLGFNRFILFVNVLLTAFCMDSSFRTHFFNGEEDLAFVRVGAVGENWAKIHARIPPRDQISSDLLVDPDVIPVGAIVIYRPMKPVGDWIVGPKLFTSNESDWNSVVKIDDLWPGTSYEYRLTSLTSPNTHHDRFPAVGRFRTVPDPRLASNTAEGGLFSFAYTSCIKPGFPYSPLKSPLHNEGAEQLAEIAHERHLDFVLFLGDFIYADSPFYAGNRVEDYWRKYRQSYASPGWKKLLQSIRTIHIYDDHEIYNDWAGQDNDADPTFQPANKAYKHYLGDANYDGPGKGENYYWFRHGDAAFFVWDCRRYRSSNQQLDDAEKTMLGATQKQVYLDWLGAVNSTVTFKFVISSTPFMTLWSGPDGAVDTWNGFTTERSELMDVMQYIPNLIVLSGDRHEFAAATIRETVIEFSTSPLNQFWLPIKTLSQENGLGATGEDKLLKYIPEGNQKFSTITIDTRDLKHPKMKFDLFIDGTVAWNLTYEAKPVTEPAKQLGELFPSWDHFMNLMQPMKWLSF